MVLWQNLLNPKLTQLLPIPRLAIRSRNPPTPTAQSRLSIVNTEGSMLFGSEPEILAKALSSDLKPLRH